MADDSSIRDPDHLARPSGEDAPKGDLLLRHAADATYLLDPQGLLVDMSDSFREMTGYTREALKGKHLSFWNLSVPLSGDPATSGPSLFRRRDGTTFPVDLVVTRLYSGEASLLHCTACPASCETNLPRDSGQNSGIAALLDNLDRACASPGEESTLASTVLSLCVRDGPMELAWISNRDDDGTFRLLATSGKTGTLEDLTGAGIDLLPLGASTGRAREDRRPVFTLLSSSPLHRSPPGKGHAEKDAPLIASYPLVSGGKVRAVLSFLIRESALSAQGVKPGLNRIAHTLSQALERAGHSSAGLLPQQDPMNLLDLSPSAMALLQDGKIVRANPPFASVLGFDDPSPLLGLNLFDLCEDVTEKDRIIGLASRTPERGRLTVPSVRLRTRTGGSVLCDIPLTRLPDPHPLTILATLIDVTEFHLIRERLQRSLDYQHALFGNNGAGLVILDDTRIVRDVNPAFCEMTGYEREEFVDQREWLLSESQESFRKFLHGFQEALKGYPFKMEIRFRCKNGNQGWAEVKGNRVLLPEGSRGIVMSMIDVTSLHEARMMTVHQAVHDPLTGMPNRLALDQTFSGAIARARRKGTVFAVGMFDLDDFKPVNDKFGHEVGNRLLQEFSVRLKSQLRESDFLARIGGDEFVAVIEDLEIGRATHQLKQLLDRLHQAVEIPFDVGPEEEARVGMSMGVAIFPVDGEDGDALLRQADAAMYQAKVNKQDRTEWWRLSPFPTNSPSQEGPFDPYSLDTNDLLNRHRAHIEAVILSFVENFFVQVSDDPAQQDILSTMDEAEIQNIAAFQAKHLTFLLTHGTTKEMILERAQQVGRIHALAGVNGALLTQSMGLYRRLLSEHLNQTFLTARDRYRILLANEVRLQDDLQGELKSGIDTTGEYFALLSGTLPQQGALWTDVRSSEIDALGKLPGIRCVFLMRLNSYGTFVVEESSGPMGPEGAAIMRDPDFEAVIDPDSPRGRGLIAHAWRSLQIQRTPSYHKDPRLPHWKEKVLPLGIRSGVSIPVKNLEGKAVAVVSLFGAYPNQFESPWMQQFTMGLGQRWEKIWELCRTPSAVLREDQAMDYRKELFSGSLSMYMQPVVDLITGKPVKVEALARLKRSGGEIISPGFFIPILGDSELDRLFRMGLDESLSWIPRWEEEGLSIDVSLNLPPGTLRDPDCPRWVEEALQTHGIAPARLTLELLENREIEHQSQDQAIHRLLDLGVKLAMDDLGAGYSSLQRLSTMPFDNIKVDQGLLKRIRIAPLQTLSMIGTIIRMGHDFERDVVVEGLEDSGMVEAAAILGSPYGQGFALARPMPADQLVEWSRSFALPIRNGHIQTFLGALAFHWRLMHSSQPSDSCPSFPDCPLTHFFDERDLRMSEGARWHALLHEKTRDFESISRKLTHWLVDKLQEETL